MFTLRLCSTKEERLLAVILTALFCASAVRAQSGDCRDEWPGHVVRSVIVKARWLPVLDLPLKRNDEFTPDKLRETRLAVIAAINAEKNRFNSEFASLGKLQMVDANLVRACGRKVASSICRAEGLGEDCVDVEVRPYALSTDPVFMGSVLLPLPRSNKFTFLGNVPRALRIFNPNFGIGYDRRLGVTPAFELSTDLLSLPRTINGEPDQGRRTALLLNVSGSKPLANHFYTSQVDLSLLARQPNDQIESLAIDAGFAAEQQPQLTSSFLKNSFRLGGHVALNPALGFLNRVLVDGDFRRSRVRLTASNGSPNISTSENSLEGRAILEGRLFNGFTRAAFWVERASPSDNGKSYGRFAALIGYEKEIPVGEHTVGVETLFGFGWASDSTPAYSRFYGGNELNNFLYDDTSDPVLMTMPAGPILRSFGKNQAGVTSSALQLGATSFQHLNVTVSLPIPRLSSPLIPDEVVNENPRITLRDLIEFAVNSGQDALSLSLEDQGLSEDQADRKAAQVFGEIRPGVNYLTKYAKIYALKPIVMFDEARLGGAVTSGTQTRYAFGGGLQLTVVVAKFEAGYLRTLNGAPGDQRGNVVLRLVFQNLF